MIGNTTPKDIDMLHAAHLPKKADETALKICSILHEFAEPEMQTQVKPVACDSNQIKATDVKTKSKETPSDAMLHP